jgi:5-methylcytosine-specific restriction endonuclease McrA
MAKLSKDQADLIRSEFNDTPQYYGKIHDLAAKYNVSKMTIHKILSGKMYKDPGEKTDNPPEHTCHICSRKFVGRAIFPHVQAHGIRFEDLKSDKGRKSKLVTERGHCCEVCKLTEWNGQKIPLELDHMDGHPEHSSKENLRLICPNCHAQTSTYRGKNANHHTGTSRQETVAKYPRYREERLKTQRAL